MSTVRVNTYSSTHTIAHVTTNLLNFLKEIVRETGLDPAYLMDEWGSLERAIIAWLNSRDLRTVVLEIYNPSTDALVAPRWDLDVIYDYSGDGTLWADSDAIRYHVRKAGLVPSSCKYRFLLDTRPGRPDVSGWGPTKYRSTEGLKRLGVGSTIGGNGIGTDTTYWRQ